MSETLNVALDRMEFGNPDAYAFRSDALDMVTVNNDTHAPLLAPIGSHIPFVLVSL